MSLSVLLVETYSTKYRDINKRKKEFCKLKNGRRVKYEFNRFRPFELTNFIRSFGPNGKRFLDQTPFNSATPP